jgi:hypothetical protein
VLKTSPVRVELPLDNLKELWPEKLRGTRIAALLHPASVLAARATTRLSGRFIFACVPVKNTSSTCSCSIGRIRLTAFQSKGRCSIRSTNRLLACILFQCGMGARGDLFRLAAFFGPQHGFLGQTQDNMVEWQSLPQMSPVDLAVEWMGSRDVVRSNGDCPG